MQQNGSSPMRADVTACWKRVLSTSQPVQEGTPAVKGYDFNQGVDYNKIFEQFKDAGFQASHLGRAIDTMNAMFDCRFQPVPPEVSATKGTHIREGRPLTNCTIFLGYTSNMVSAGTRDIIRYLVQHNMVDCIVSTAGGIEEDFMKCLGTFYLGDFSLKGCELHKKNHNRTGNLIVPNNCYRSFHEFINPILEEMMEEQKSGAEFTPSKLVWRLGRAINHPESIYYWAYKNQIPVFSPAITDGAIGDNLFYHRHAHPHGALKLDIVEDIQAVNDMALGSIHTGLLIIGGGLIKHHILNANTFHTGGDFSVYINTAAEFDGSDAGATPEEAVSWGKIAVLGRRIKVFADATLVLPILVGETFAKREKEFEEFNKKYLSEKPTEPRPAENTPAGI